MYVGHTAGLGLNSFNGFYSVFQSTCLLAPLFTMKPFGPVVLAGCLECTFGPSAYLWESTDMIQRQISFFLSEGWNQSFFNKLCFP